jgi:DNA-directed RNA polymerase subunit RPC12/RpoP
MSDLIFYCANCGAKLSAAEDEAGEEFECPTCNTTQVVPGGESGEAPVEKRPEGTPAQTEEEKTSEAAEDKGGRVVHVPKKKIVIAKTASAQEDEEDELDEEAIEEEIDDEVAGTGMRIAAMALGTAGILLILGALIWILLAPAAKESGVKEWSLIILTFAATFLLGLMGLVLSQMAFRVERIAAYARFIALEED